MLRAEIKRLNGKKWEPIPVDEVVDKSLIDWMETTEGVIIVALFEDDKPVAFISNRQHYVDMYKNKGFAALSSDLKYILLPSLEPIQLIANIFPDSTIHSIQVPE